MLCYHCMREKGDAAVCPHCHAQDNAVLQPHQIAPGTMIGNRYTLGNVIGEGGFGITYIALENTLGITVAIKEYYPFGYCNRNSTASNTVSVTSDDKQQIFEKGRSRFLREAKTLAKFQVDPGVVNVIDFLEENNTAYIVMEFLDGIDLREYLRQNGTMAPEKAVQMLLPSMRALDKIHKAGVIHRDISPDNIMVLRDGSLKLMDFGAARDFEGVDSRSMSIMLKQGYAPAEQYRRNGEQGPWTDVYGMCATIYRAITGVTPVDSIDRVYQDTLQTPSQCGVKITPALENTIMYGLAVHKENRCPDMNTLIDLFEKALRGQNIPAGAVAGAVAGAAVFRDNRTGDPNQTVAADAYHTRYAQNNQQHPDQYQRGYQPPVPPYPPQPQPRQPMPRKRSYAPIIAGLLVFIAVLSVVITVVAVVNRNQDNSSSAVEAETAQMQKIPNLTGMTKEEAINTLSKMGLSVDNFIETETEKQSAGKVFDQVPKSNTEVSSGTAITVYVAKTPETQAPEPVVESKIEVSKNQDQHQDYTPSSGVLYCTARSYVVVHRSAGTGSAELGKIWKGASVKNLGYSSGWYYIDDGSVRGYVSADYVSSSASDIPSSTDPIYVDDDIDDGFLALRASASENSTKLLEIPTGATITYLGTAQDNGYVRSDGYHVRWAKVRYNGKEGYVYDLYVHD